MQWDEMCHLAVEILGIPHTQSYSFSQHLHITGNSGSPKEVNLGARSPPQPSHRQTPRFKVAGTKIQQAGGDSPLQSEQALTICNLTRAPVPKHCRDTSTPALLAASGEDRSTAQPLEQLFISFHTLRHIWERGEVKWKDKWNTTVF